MTMKFQVLTLFSLSLPVATCFAMEDLSKTIMKSVLVVGGTHGNEYTGVWCIKQLERQLAKGTTRQKYPSLQIETLLANKDAYLANRRFLDTDLNRAFTMESLLAEESSVATNEGRRAQEIDKLFGPKSNPTRDFCVDLHTTTCNMGVAIIIQQGDPLAAQAAAWIVKKLNNNNQRPKARIMTLPNIPREDLPYLLTIGKKSMLIEVGPTPQGVVRHDIVEDTNAALHALLEFLQLRNESGPERVLRTLRDYYPNQRVVCYSEVEATKQGSQQSIHAKLTWPASEDNPNFPGWLVHKKFQDQDFQVLKTGDPIFVDLENNVVPYDGSFGQEVYCTFINEGGYYYSSSGSGIDIVRKAEIDFTTGDLIAEEEEEKVINPIN